MKPINASLNVVLEPPRLMPPAAPYTFLGVAESFLNGIRPLANHGIESTMPLALVCAHTLECILKAYISRDGTPATALKARKFNHDLKALWNDAHSAGLKIPAALPDWADNLARLHNAPYHLRYAEGIHIITTPAAEPMASEIGAIVTMVRREIVGS
jgi:hypothetical protein